MSPLAVIADFIPFLGSIVRMGTGIVAFFLAIVVGTITIAIAWFYYRPLLAIGILAAGAVIAAAVIYLGRSRRHGGGHLPRRSCGAGLNGLTAATKKASILACRALQQRQDLALHRCDVKRPTASRR